MTDYRQFHAFTAESHALKAEEVSKRAVSKDQIIAALEERRKRLDELNLSEGCTVVIKTENGQEEREFVCLDESSSRVWVREINFRNYKNLKLCSPFDIIKVIPR